MNSEISYFLYIRPTILIWEDKYQILFYDTERQEAFAFRNSTDYIREIINRLLLPSNLYCVSVILDQCQTLIDFIELNELGVLKKTTEKHKPVAIPPFICFPKEIIHPVDDLYDTHSIEYIRTITINISGKCNHHCLNCGLLYKQTYYCTESDSDISIENLTRIADRIKQISVRRLNLIISCSLKGDTVLQILDIFSSISSIKYLFLHWKNVPVDSKDFYTGIDNKSYTPVYLFDVSNENKELVEMFVEKLVTSSNRFLLSFCVASLEDISYVNNLTKSKNTERYYFCCYHNGCNTEFLESYYYLSEEELLNQKADTNAIFSNAVMNRRSFGELFISNNGEISLDENGKVVGSIFDPIQTIVQTILSNKDNQWLLTRLNKCQNCSYRMLCPPISKLELYVGEIRACKDYYKKIV